VLLQIRSSNTASAAYGFYGSYVSYGHEYKKKAVWFVITRSLVDGFHTTCVTYQKVVPVGTDCKNDKKDNSAFHSLNFIILCGLTN